MPTLQLMHLVYDGSNPINRPQWHMTNGVPMHVVVFVKARKHNKINLLQYELEYGFNYLEWT